MKITANMSEDEQLDYDRIAKPYKDDHMKCKRMAREHRI
jgi:hypothetical protein